MERLDADPAFLKGLKLTKTYEKRLAESLKLPAMRKYLSWSLDPALASTTSEAEEHFVANGIITSCLVEKARWDAKNPGEEFRGYM